MDFTNFSTNGKRRSDYGRFLADRHPGEQAEDHQVGNHIRLDRWREFLGWMLSENLIPPHHEADAKQYIVRLMFTELTALGEDPADEDGTLVAWFSILGFLASNRQWYDNVKAQLPDGGLIPLHALGARWMNLDTFCARDAAKALLNWDVEHGLLPEATAREVFQQL